MNERNNCEQSRDIDLGTSVSVKYQTLFRKNDYENEDKNIKNKSLTKSLSFFEPVKQENYFGGGSSYGPFKHNTKPGIYYISPHHLNEYFASEIMVRIGFISPKIRILAQTGYAGCVISSKGIDDYIPIKVVRHYSVFGNIKKDDLAHSQLISLRNRYELDIDKQIIQDHLEGKSYRISGNLFAADIIAFLICDSDFQSDGDNLGVVKLDSRFYAVAIDKDRASFLGYDYEFLTQELSHIIQDNIFKSRMDEQVIAVLDQIQKALIPGQDDISDFDKIFFNPRNKATSQLLDHSSDSCCLNIKKTAISILSHYKIIYGDNFLEKYSVREDLRIKIACHVMSNLECYDLQCDVIQKNIIEDLRGPYYKYLFADQINKLISLNDLENKKLLEKILTDVYEEHTLKVQNDNSTLCKF